MKASVESQSAPRLHSLQDDGYRLLSSTQALAGEVVNDVSFYPNSGLMLVANDHQRRDATSRLQVRLVHCDLFLNIDPSKPRRIGTLGCV